MKRTENREAIPNSRPGEIRLSIVCICKSENELAPLRNKLEKQTFKDFELVYSTLPSIPEAWNDAISRANGEFILFVESDALPLSDRWVETALRYAERGKMIKGLEVPDYFLSMCNLLVDANIVRHFRFDSSFPIAEDSELFTRLHSAGYDLNFVPDFAVLHRKSERKLIRRSFAYGRHHIKNLYLHGYASIAAVEGRSPLDGLLSKLIITVSGFLYFLGVLVGIIIYLPVLMKRLLLNLKTEK